MLSLNEIRARALAFSKEWADEWSEDAEAKSFWDDFFNVFGVSRRRVANFEKSVERNDGRTGFIDLLWKGVLLIEHKSRGKDLDRAYTQAKDYFQGLHDRDLPRYVLVCDFQRFRLFDYDENTQVEFSLAELPENIHQFGFISGYQRRDFGKEDPASIDAGERMGALHDMLKKDGYDGHPLEVLLVRLLFCMFAEDTGIFEANLFREYIETRTSEDGADLGYHLAMLFQVLNTPENKRLRSLDEQMASFPYVNGKLFEENLPLAAFNSQMRNSLLECCALDWSRISPAIFGSLFQSAMDVKLRRSNGAHYTWEQNILKALQPLFLDDLRAELERLKVSRSTARNRQLQAYLDKLAAIRVLDPACGCGNFLVIAYRELRQLELEALQVLHTGKSQHLDITILSRVDVDQCYGIEIEDFPVQIAMVALWLTDHQMNMALSRAFGNYYVRLPLTRSATIVHGNALEIAWEDVVKPEVLSYIVGNPPFKGKKEQTSQDKKDLKEIFADVQQSGVIDYVACWHKKAVKIMKEHSHIRTAFVSTNSICQGEQVAPLWRNLFDYGVKISFCHRTFQWSNEARNTAAVHCIILGLTCGEISQRVIYDYETPKSQPVSREVSNINPYLIDYENILIDKASRPIAKDVPVITKGSEGTDFGYLIIESKEEFDEILRECPQAKKWMPSYKGGDEVINGKDRWCLWLVGVSPDVIRKSSLIKERIDAVRKKRAESKKLRTREWAKMPTLFTENRQPENVYLAIPKVSSESRAYLPMAFLHQDIIASGSLQTIDGASLYHFGILTSTMHMAWMRHICGRMKSDYQYSNSIVYNNFPWPGNPSKAQIGNIEKAAQAVLNARAEFPDSTLADLYDPNTMPPVLLRAHQQLDRAVDAAYGRKSFSNEMERMELLFALYKQLV